jgi:hypothetical protein
MPVLMSEVEGKRDGITAIKQNKTGRVFRDVHASSKGSVPVHVNADVDG